MREHCFAATPLIFCLMRLGSLTLSEGEKLTLLIKITADIYHFVYKELKFETQTTG